MKIISKVFLFFSTQSCWKCKSKQTVIALGSNCIEEPDVGILGNANNLEDIILLSNIAEMPNELYEQIYKLHPRFKSHYSNTAESTYFANICECGANFGDFYLFSEPDGAFWPTIKETASKITYCCLPFNGPFDIEANWSQGPGKFIFDNGSELII